MHAYVEIFDCPNSNKLKSLIQLKTREVKLYSPVYFGLSS